MVEPPQREAQPRVIRGESSLTLKLRSVTRSNVADVVIKPRKDRGRPRNPGVAERAARIEGPEFKHLDSLRAKCRELMWIEHQEDGGDRDELTEEQLVKRAEACRMALLRWYEKHT
jgi:hypothetical protein